MRTWAADEAPWTSKAFAEGVRKSILPIVEEIERLYDVEASANGAPSKDAPKPGTLAAARMEAAQLGIPMIPTDVIDSIGETIIIPLVAAIRYHADKTAPKPRGRPKKLAP